MKVIFLLLFFPLISLSQKKNGIRTMQIFTNKQLTLITDYDVKGNCVFTKNIGMNGPITMLFVNDYDARDRETKSYWAHSNLGFMLSENSFEKDRVLSYSYAGDSITNESIERSLLESIDSKEEFFALPQVRMLENSKRYLQSIDVTDSLNRTKISYSFSEEGDTTTITTTYFNKDWEELRFHYESQSDSNWIWDIYYDFDNRRNMIRSYRVELEDGRIDTTEVYNYKYDESGKMIEDNYYYQGEFQNKTLYQYDKQDRLIEELFFEQENEWDVLTTFKYDNKTGWIKKKVLMDLRLPFKERKKVMVYNYQYF